MPRTSKPRAYRHHKASGQAIVTIRGKDHYLGTYGSATSRDAYANLLAASSAPEPSVASARFPAQPYRLTP